jgi:hypothetical protein
MRKKEKNIIYICFSFIKNWMERKVERKVKMHIGKEIGKESGKESENAYWKGN